MNGYGTKEDYSKALQVYQTYISEIWSEQRNEAAAYSDHYKYFRGFSFVLSGLGNNTSVQVWEAKNGSLGG